MAKPGTTSKTNGVFVEFAAAVLRALPRDLQSELMLEWTGNGAALTHALRKAFLTKPYFSFASNHLLQGLSVLIYSVKSDMAVGDLFAELERGECRILSASDVLDAGESARMFDPIRRGTDGEIKVITVRKRDE